jgi:hypothetical protein
MLGPIDYRSPHTGNARIRSVRDHFRLRQYAMLAKVVALCLLGVPATFLGPWIISAICFTVSSRLGWHVSGAWFFWGATAIAVPLLFRLEWQTHGRYFEDSVAGAGSTSGWQSMNTWNALAGFYGDPEIVASGLTEISLWGPRQILDAAEKLRMVRRMKHVNRRQTEEVVARLLASDHGVVIENLGLSEQDTCDLLPALAYLLVYDWIGVSKDGRRIWLTDESRKKLAS